MMVALTLAAGTMVGVMAVAPAAQARTCPSERVGGRTVAWITVADIKVPIKRIGFRRGGQLDPPATNKAAGLSAGHAPLRARMGTTVLTWHKRFGPGCDGTLNPILSLPIGGTFAVRGVGQQATDYQVVAQYTVPKGRYRSAWFRQQGPHQLALFTCADLRGGSFHKTVAIIAKPVAPPPAAVVPEPVPADPAATSAPAPQPTPTAQESSAPA